MENPTQNLKRHSIPQTPQMVASIRGLCKSFAGKLALDNIDLDIKPSQVLAILGANGAGKTTLINTLLGRLSFDSGSVDILSASPGADLVKQHTGAMLQVATLPETLKVKEHIQLFQSYYPAPMPYKKVIAYAGLESLQDRYSKKLSGGEKQRLLFALSICGNPKLLFLDEPSVAMDVEARTSLWQGIRDLKEQGTAIILTTHYLEEADSLADEIVLLKEGKIIQRGTSEQIKATVSTTTIRFATPDNKDNFLVYSGVTDVDISGKFTSIQTCTANQTLLELLTRHPEVKDLSVSKAGLERAFLELNKNEQNQGEAA